MKSNHLEEEIRNMLVSMTELSDFIVRLQSMLLSESHNSRIASYDVCKKLIDVIHKTFEKHVDGLVI